MKNYKHRNSTPFDNPVNTPTTNKPNDTLIPGKEPVDVFIDNLIEGKESIIQDLNKVLPISLLLQREFEKTWLLLLTAILNSGQTSFQTLNTVCTIR